MVTVIRYLTGITLLLVFVGLYLYLHYSGTGDSLFNQGAIQDILRQLDAWGPLLIILLMGGAIVMSPLPSAPIALAAGAVFGHTMGTIYILIGAELGAIIAFSIARMLGYEVMKKRFGDKINIKWLQSENNLMLIVAVSRLVPFISFDVVSYAAGLTSLSYLRFALATLIGIIPASFLLAHFGSQLVTSELPNMLFTVLLLGAVTGVPLLVGYVITRYKNARP